MPESKFYNPPWIISFHDALLFVLNKFKPVLCIEGICVQNVRRGKEGFSETSLLKEIFINYFFVLYNLSATNEINWGLMCTLYTVHLLVLYCTVLKIHSMKTEGMIVSYLCAQLAALYTYNCLLIMIYYRLG